METLGFLPWVVALLSAAAFGAMGAMFRKSIIGWTITGLLAGLAVGTVFIGLAEAATVPYTPENRAASHLRGALLAAGLMLLMAAVTYWFTRRIQSV